MNNKMLNRSGFTLVELLVVVLIIGILAAVALPQYQQSVKKAFMSEAQSTIGSLERAYTACADGKIANNGCTMDELGVSVPTTSTSGEWHFVVAGGSSSNQCNGRTAISSSYNFICAYEHGYAKGDSDYPALVSFRSGPGQRWTHRCQWTTTDQKKLCQSISASGYEVPNSAS